MVYMANGPAFALKFARIPETLTRSLAIPV